MKTLVFTLVFGLVIFNCRADRIYIMNATGYNTAEAQLVSAITNNGHTVVVNSTSLNALPSGFTSTCIDATKGYDWLCFFGNRDFSGLSSDIRSFINNGGKVFYQYEVSCCTDASTSVAGILSALTGRTITPNSNSYIALGSNKGAWDAQNVGCCSITFLGNAYKGLDGMPNANQMLSTSNLNGSSPPVTTCSNFGFVFTTTDFTGTAKKGAIVGLGDVNIWYDADEPITNGGKTQVNMKIIDYFFPNRFSQCFLLPPGCLTTFTPKKIKVDIGPDTVLCAGNFIRLYPAIPGGKFKWQDGSADSVFVASKPGKYWVEVATGCGTGTDTILIKSGPAPKVKLGNDTLLCMGQTLDLHAYSPGSAFQWQDNSTDTVFKVTGKGLYWVRVTNNCGSFSDSIRVDYLSPPVVHLGNDTSLCDGETLLLKAVVKGGKYIWQDNTGDSTLLVRNQGTYWLKASNLCGQTADTLVVNYQPNPLVNLGNDTVLCKGALLMLDITTNNATYLWDDGSANASRVINAAGNYWAGITVNRCSAFDSIQVGYYPEPLLDLGSDTVLCYGEVMHLNATVPDATYQWQDNSVNPHYTVIAPGTYFVNVSYICGVLRDTVIITGKDCEMKVFIPNAFTPNDDSENDVFKVFGTNIVHVEMDIYNRWGEHLLSVSGKDPEWDGTYKEEMCQESVYLYIIKVQGRKAGNVKYFNGTLILLR